MHMIVEAVGKAAGTSAASIRETRGSVLRRLAAWIGWYERANHAAIDRRRLADEKRGTYFESHPTMRPRICSADEILLGYLDAALGTLRA